MEVNRRLLPDRRYVEQRTGYTWETDSQGRVQVAEGSLVDESGHRNSYQQAKSGRKDRLDTDDGGHLFATIFRGPGERINLVPMDANLNRGVWKSMESAWAKALALGKSVKIAVRIRYEGDTDRPRQFIVRYQVQGKDWVVRTFFNRSGGK